MIDKVDIKISAGDGGDGIVSFRRERFMPKGGPDGGDGGDGGDVYFVVDPNMGTLLDFRSKPDYKGQSGARGMKKVMTGPDGEDLEIRVPLGTIIYENSPDETILVGDMVAKDEDSSRILMAKGGRGGRGNDSFKSSVNQTPMQSTRGTPGEEKSLTLELKLIADIGLIGFPNAGKSTLINKFTNANAKTANYPFTTLTPNLGPLKLKSGQTVILADIPGLIEGASTGKGLGDDFLRHIERTRVLVHLVDPMTHALDGNDMHEHSIKAYTTLRNELSEYGAGLETKPEIVVINKVDITEVKEALPGIVEEFNKIGVSVIGISAVTGEGLDVLEERLLQVLEKAPPKVTFESKEKPVKIYTVDTVPNRRLIRG